MDKHTQRINLSLIRGWLGIVFILIVAYGFEVLKHERTLPYLLVFIAVMVIPLILVSLLYVWKPDMQSLSYVIVAGYSVMYAFVLFTGRTQMVYCYILPMLSFLVLYHKTMLILITGGITFIINAISIKTLFDGDTVTVSNSKDLEIRVAVLVVCFVGSYVSANLYDHIHRDNENFTEELTKKNQAIQDMTIQTIVTIANTIDAKDEYTRGHSRRVAEYSTMIAQEMGLDGNMVREIRSIALLHDIGKIGVPDSVLNKPGKLTNEEYDIMKQHTMMGAEILKDIGMLPGIDVGAKYHHERYDGKGYPDGLAGEDIPLIARIIAVADAFDAMTSNRVYRKHLDMERVMGELEKGRGLQFDPEADDALITMLKEKRLKPLGQDTKEDQQVSDMSKIWTRVLEMGEEKYKDKSHQDELTGLFNRTHGEMLIRESVETNKGTLMIVDLDHFRRINGEGGFLLGDIFLRSVATCIDKIEENKIAARYGGDEFVIFLPDNTDREKVTRIIERFMTQIQDSTAQISEEFDLTVSIGIQIAPGMKNIYHDIFLGADKSLYYSKQQGGNCYRFYEKKSEEGGFSTKENVDLKKLRETIRHPEKYSHYISESQEFQNAYELVKKLLDAGESPVQMILFSVNPNEGVNVSLESQNHVMEYLEKAIARSIKGKDYTFRYSSTQRMVLLTNSGEEGAGAVSRHIMKEFYKIYDKTEVNVSYSMMDIS